MNETFNRQIPLLTKINFPKFIRSFIFLKMWVCTNVRNRTSWTHPPLSSSTPPSNHPLVLRIESFPSSRFRNDVTVFSSTSGGHCPRSTVHVAIFRSRRAPSRSNRYTYVTPAWNHGEAEQDEDRTYYARRGEKEKESEWVRERQMRH